MTIEILDPDSPTDDDFNAIRRLLLEHNAKKVGAPGPHKMFVLRLRDHDGVATGGGLLGEVYFNWLSIYILVVPESERGRGVGSALLRRAEAFARDCDCIGVWLDTFTFQAPGFYRKHGYEAFGELKQYPGAESRIFIRKFFRSAPLL